MRRRANIWWDKCVRKVWSAIHQRRIGDNCDTEGEVVPCHGPKRSTTGYSFMAHGDMSICMEEIEKVVPSRRNILDTADVLRRTGGTETVHGSNIRAIANEFIRSRASRY